jgi:integrase
LAQLAVSRCTAASIEGCGHRWTGRLATLRHSFGTLMKANGEDVKTIQELLRHANFKVTMDVYTQAVTVAKRTAHSAQSRGASDYGCSSGEGR